MNHDFTSRSKVVNRDASEVESEFTNDSAAGCSEWAERFLSHRPKRTDIWRFHFYDIDVEASYPTVSWLDRHGKQ